MTPRHITDPIELILARAMDRAGVRYVHHSEGQPDLTLGHDFYVHAVGVRIECGDKQPVSWAAEMPALIVVKGKNAALWLADLIEDNGRRRGRW